MKDLMIVMGVPEIERIGGYERQALKLTKVLQGRGIETTVLSCYSTHPGKVLREIWGIPIVRLGVPDSLEGFGTFQACLGYLSGLQKHGKRPVIHCHAAADFSFILMAAAQKLGLPTVLKIATESDVLQLEQSLYLARKVFKGGPSVRKVLERVGAVISLNENISEELRTVLQAGATTKSYSNVIDVKTDLIGKGGEGASTLQHDLTSQGLRYAIMTNRLERRKQSFPLIRAWMRLPNDLRLRWRLVVIGDGEEMLPIRSFLAEHGDGSVLMLGERSDFLELLTHADLFVFASEREGNPNGLLEAMARGLRILATDIEGVGDCLPVTYAGHVFSLGRAEEIEQAHFRIGEALRTIDGSLNGGESEKPPTLDLAVFCNELFGPDQMVDCYTRLYERLVEQSRR